MDKKINTLKETFNYTQGLAKIWDTKTPAQLIFFVTSRCNSRCRHCFYWQEINKNTQKELTLSEIKKVSKSMGKMIWLFLSGGEPFLREDLPEICKTFYENNKVKSIIIPTNALLVDKVVTNIEKIAKSCPRAKVVLQLSIDEIGIRHDAVRGVKGNFNKITEIVPKLKEVQKKYPNLGLQANVVFTKFNQDRVMKIYNYLYEKFNLDNICLSLVRGTPREVGADNIDIRKYLRAHREMQQSKRFKHYGSVLSYLITKKEDMQVDMFVKSRKEKKAVIPCLAGKQSAVLYPTGELALCELRGERFGNVRDVNYNFDTLWQSPTARLIRKLVGSCYCTQECVYTTNVFLNPAAWPTFLKYLAFKNI